MKQSILIQPEVKGAEEFRHILVSNSLQYHVALSIDEVKLEEVEIVVIWFNVPEFLFQLTNLKLILVCGSGVDHLIKSPFLPHHIPLVRLVDEYLRTRVANYVADKVSRYMQMGISGFNTKISPGFADIEAVKKPKIGIMGLGLIGSSVAKKLATIGFEVCGWVRTNRARCIENVYVGSEGIDLFLKNSDVVVCQLPLTDDTYGILCQQLFERMREGTYLINVGRGAHLVEADLIAAIESGKICGACLDVFEVEPLPQWHPFRSNSRITITPHIAGYVGPETQAPYAVQVINDFNSHRINFTTVDYKLRY